MKPTSSQQLQKILQKITPEEINSNIIKDRLNPRLWSADGDMDPEVREKLLDIANRFYKYLGVEVPIEDILITGSNAGYDWHKESDIDIHLVIDYSLIGDEKFVRGIMNSMKQNFNTMRKGVRIKGHEIECYCQDKNEIHKPKNLFSLQDNKWLYQEQPIHININEKLVKQIMSVITRAINNLDSIENYQERLEKSIELKNAIVSMRRLSVRQKSEFSEPNIAFKFLRRLGHIDRLFDIIRNSLDEKLSLAEAKKVSGSVLQEDSSGDKQIRELVKKELEILMKKEFSTRPILSKVEIERIAQSKVKLELKDNLTLKDVKGLIRSTMLAYHKWMWEKKGVWLNQI